MMSGLLLVLFGIWGGLVPFIGPYFTYGYGPSSSWYYNTDRLYMVILPAAAAVLGGLLVMGSANRVTAMFGGWLAAVAGAWFVVAVPLGPIWRGVTNPAGGPLGMGATHHAIEQIGVFTGVGVCIVFLAALSLGRFLVVGAREARMTGAHAGATGTAMGAGYRAGRSGEQAPAEDETQIVPGMHSDRPERGATDESGVRSGSPTTPRRGPDENPER